ncbi:MAG: nuclear transport factor 2 family protein [Burkholderiaceae bacterium]|nr:nuclear transport factor 2 family protein [Burkholderiaceae bacterium]
MNELLALLDDYFELLYRCDIERFDRVFHRNASLQTVGADGYRHLSAGEYKKILKARVSPQSRSAPRRDEIEMVDMTSRDSALAKVSVQINEARFRDYLSLLRTSDGWRIVAKVYCTMTSA